MEEEMDKMFSTDDYPAVEEIISAATPKEGERFKTRDDAFYRYALYARKEGFAVKKFSSKRSGKNGEIYMQTFACNKEGCTNTDAEPSSHRRTNILLKTDCKAQIIVKQFDGYWYIKKILGIGTLDGFDQVKMAYKRRRKDTEISGDTEYLLKLGRAYDAVMMEQLQNRKKEVVTGSVQVLKDIKYADNQPVVPWGPRYSRSTAMDLRINMAISATSTLCMLTMGHADWKPLQFLCFAYFCRMLEKLNSTEPAITPAYNEYVEVEGRGIHMAKRVLRCFGLILGSLHPCSVSYLFQGYTGLTNFSQFLGHYIPPVVYNLCISFQELIVTTVSSVLLSLLASYYR
ncbi:uncharacterized protein LOC124681564 [Lolium rigidum]|uniref:uncharacterized protein LOC124681564 n=1 Tax=Lolium rigidum TaxID=89674 RepID=UPI001F5CA8D0|nr:uncharacterized protein LOC124681564 [Lolium rigidum]